jgi:hypothetical protein
MEIINYELQPVPRSVNVIDNQDEIYLTIQIGNGQIGGSKVTLNNEVLAKGNLSQPTSIGNSNKLLNNEIEVETNVLDVNQFANMCVITTTFLNQDNKVLLSKIDNGVAPENGIASFKGIYRIAFFLLLILFLNVSHINSIVAQSTPDKIAFQSLETPSSPGFILLDKAPSSVERPTTPQGFGVTVLGLFNGPGGAMEFAPFWLFNHPNLTAQEMYNNRFPILYNFSISAATIKTDTSSYLAGGFRTRLFQSYNKSTRMKLDSLKEQLEDALAVLDIAKIVELQKSYTELIENPIFTIDLAGAIGGGSNTNSYDDVALNRWSAWLSINWRPKGKDFYATALTRLISNENFEEYTMESTLFDIGTRLNYDMSKFCLSLEYLQRYNLTNSIGSDFRIAAIGSYRLSDNFFITTTFGKNFSDINNIIALAGVNFGISKSKVKAF